MFTGRIAPLLASLCLLVVCSAAKKSDKELFDEIKKFDTCVAQATFSFASTDYNPPKTPADFGRMCKRHDEGIKCLRTKTKGAEALIRRGLLALANTRSRQHRRLCSNSNGDHSKRFLAASKCAMETSLDRLREIDINLAKSMIAVVQKNYNDSRPELKQLCCTLYDFKSGILKTTSDACPSHRTMLQELVSSIVTEDSTLVCEEDEKLAKSCSKLERLPIDRIQVKNWPLPTVMALYAFATLGEPSERPFSFQ